MPDAASPASVQPPPFILDLRNRSPPTSPNQLASDAARSSSPSSLGESEDTASTHATSEAPSDPLREQIIAGLIGSSRPTVPGRTEKDAAFAYRRTIPTMTLYSERGLSIYEDITKTKAYYPFEAEKEILEKYGDEIACRMFGLPSSLLVPDGLPRHGDDQYEPSPASNVGAKKEKWGDATVGLHNYGVNGSANLADNNVLATHGLAVELGSGSLDKTRHLLRSMAKLLQSGGDGSRGSSPLQSIDYKALDLEAASLYSTLSSLASVEGDCVTTSLEGQPGTRRRVSVSGLHATYDEGLAFLKAQQDAGSPQSVFSDLPDLPTSPKSVAATLASVIEDENDEGQASEAANGDRAGQAGRRATSIMWLGSSCGNYTREEAVQFLRNIDLREGDTMLIGIDGCADGPRIETAYNDPQGVTRAFILEGIDVAGRTLGGAAADVLKQENFDYVNRWNGELGRHEAYVRANKDLTVPIAGAEDVPEVSLKEGELLNIEFSYKYTYAEAVALFHLAGFRLVQYWTDSSRSHYLYLVEKPHMWFPATKESAAKMLGVQVEDAEKENDYGVPTLEKWEEMWRAWDGLMLKIIPESLHFQKPIPLRHIPLFYVGHIPAFRDIHLARYFGEPLTEPANFADIFERGIDPCVDDPETITHWHSEVPKDEKSWPSLQEISAYEASVRDRVRKVYAEHEGKWTTKLARVLMMTFEHEMMHWETSVYICLQAATSLNLPPGTAIPDFRALARQAKRDLALNGGNQKIPFPAQEITVGHDDDDTADDETPFRADRVYGWDVEHPRRRLRVDAFEIDALPISNGQYQAWLEETRETSNSSLVPSSWTEHKGELCVKTLFGLVPFKLAEEWPVAASADQLERFAKAKGGRLPTFGELSAFNQQNPISTPLSNVGFANLHPIAPYVPGKARDGTQLPIIDGGLWQWTSTTLEPWKGYSGSVLYPGYSSDFFDGKHHIVLGSSYASPRRLARPTFLNWYQKNYPFMLGGARVAYDA
ncbi:hypothetical protein JCM10908_006688 [Rhodotorula pacifica]|uniref:uncharacterized protein n=1 Tax=Rhodotorula pacifica TaxID=1495444 RepID=UPI003180C454